jgi:hypothetical protein
MQVCLRLFPSHLFPTLELSFTKFEVIYLPENNTPRQSAQENNACSHCQPNIS